MRVVHAALQRGSATGLANATEQVIRDHSDVGGEGVRAGRRGSSLGHDDGGEGKEASYGGS